MKHFNDMGLGAYVKNMKTMFLPLLPYQEMAIKHAKKLCKKGEVQNNPSTAIHLLVEELLKYFG